jgi:hypothetical protein
VDISRPSVSSLQGQSLQSLGTGTTLSSQQGRMVLQLADTDRVRITQTENTLCLEINGKEEFRLTPHDSSRLDVHGRQDQVTVDASVRMAIGGIFKSDKTTSESGGVTIEAYRRAGSHLSELCVAMGGSKSLRQINTHRDLVPVMRNLLDTSNRSYSSPPGPMLLELLKLAKMMTQQILSGETPDVSTMDDTACQVASSLQAQPGTNSAIGSGMTPPPGMKADEFADKQKEISEAISKGDLGKMRDIANDPKRLACADPEQKAQMATALAKDSDVKGTTKPQENASNDKTQFAAILGQENDRSKDREAINKIMGSAASPEEFNAIAQEVGPDLLKKGMAPLPGDSQPDKCSTDFDVVAGAFGSPGLAIDPQRAKEGLRAIDRGFSPQDVVEARQKISYTDKNKMHPVPNDPLLSAVVTNDEKAAMIKTLKGGTFRDGDKDDRTIANLAMTSENKADYDDLMSKAGKDIISVDEKEAHSKMQRLAAGFGRTDLVTDPGALKYKDALIDPAKRKEYLGGAGELEKPRDVQPSNTGDPVQDFKRTNQEEISADLERMDPLSQNDTILVNVGRESDGKPPLNPVELRKEAQALAEQPDQKPSSPFEKVPDLNDKIDQLRKQEGLSEYDARNLLTQPCARAYEKGASEASGYLASQLQPLQDQLQQVQAAQGPFSPEARALQAKIDGINKQIKPYVDHVSDVAGKFDKMYPPPANPLEQVGQFLLSMLESVGPALLNLIPGVGNILFAGYEGVRSVVDMVQGNFLGALGDVAGALPGIGSAVGGVAEDVLGTVGNVVGKGTQAASAISHGDAFGALSSIAGGFGALGNVGGTVGDVFDEASKDISLVSKGASAVQGIASGDVGKIAQGLSGVADGITGLADRNATIGNVFQNLKNLAPPGSALGEMSNLFGNAVQLTGAFTHGDFGAMAQDLQNLDLPPGIPLAPEVVNFAQSGASFMAEIKKGNINGALDELSSSDNPILQNVGGVLQDGNTFLSSLGGGLDSALGGMATTLTRFAGDPSVKDVTQRLLSAFQVGKMASQIPLSSGLLQLAQGGPANLSDKSVVEALQFTNRTQGFLQDLATGTLRSSVGGLGTAAQGVLNSDAWQDVNSIVRAGGTFMSALRNGELETAIQQVKPDNPQLRRSLDEALRFSHMGRDFFQTVENPNLAPQLARLINALATKAPKTSNTMREVAGGSSVLGALASGYFGNVLASYQRQLQSLVRLGRPDSSLGRMEAQAQQMLATGRLQETLLRALAGYAKKSSDAGKEVLVKAQLMRIAG